MWTGGDRLQDWEKLQWGISWWSDRVHRARTQGQMLDTMEMLHCGGP